MKNSFIHNTTLYNFFPNSIGLYKVCSTSGFIPECIWYLFGFLIFFPISGFYKRWFCSTSRFTLKFISYLFGFTNFFRILGVCKLWICLTSGFIPESIWYLFGFLNFFSEFWICPNFGLFDFWVYSRIHLVLVWVF